MTTDGLYDTTKATDDANFAIRPVSRRLLIRGGAVLGVGLTALGTAQQAEAAPERLSARWNGPSTRAAIRFLKGVTNAHRTSGPRLAQSYQDASGLQDTAFVYDNALAIIALLKAGEGAAARALGDGLLYAQNHDENYTDGRLRQAYHAKTFIHADGTAHFGREFGLTGTAVGDMSWAGIALAQLARATGIGRYRAGALKIARLDLPQHARHPGLGGYTFGRRPAWGPQVDRAQHRRRGLLPVDRHLAGRAEAWRRADHAWAFVEQVWNADDGFFWTGSDDGSEDQQARRPAAAGCADLVVAGPPAAPTRRRWTGARATSPPQTRRSG